MGNFLSKLKEDRGCNKSLAADHCNPAGNQSPVRRGHCSAAGGKSPEVLVELKKGSLPVEQKMTCASYYLQKMAPTNDVEAYNF